MLVVITYDVNTETAAGRKRLRQIAKQCVNYGQRVQNSVFECLLDAAQCRMLQAKLVSIMDEELDSLRFYYLGNQYEQNTAFRTKCRLPAGRRPDGVAQRIAIPAVPVRTRSARWFWGTFAREKCRKPCKNGLRKRNLPCVHARPVGSFSAGLLL